MAKILERVKVLGPKPPVPEGMDYIFTESHGGMHLVIDKSDERVTNLLNRYFKKHPLRLLEVVRVIQVENKVTVYRHFVNHYQGGKTREREDEYTFVLSDVLYLEYLETEEWKERAKKCRERAGFRCQICNSCGPLTAHHRTYEQLGHEDPDDLIAVCPRCHFAIHKYCTMRRDG